MKQFLRTVILLAFFLTACTNNTPTAVPPTATRTPKPAPSLTLTPDGIQIQADSLRGLTLRVAHPWFGTDASMFESMVEEFNNTNPWGINVVATGNMNYSILYDNVSAALPTSEIPHVAVALPEHARLWDAQGFVVDLTPYMVDPQYGWDMSEVTDFIGLFWAQDVDGARRLALPFQRSARFLLWNQTWASELGFDSPPVIPADFRQQACRARQSKTTDATPDNDALGGWIVDTDPMTALSWMRVFGGGVLEEGKYHFTSDANVEAFAFTRKLQEDGCAWMPMTDIDPLTAFAERNALFISADLGQFPSVTRAFGTAGNTDKWVPLAYPGEKPALPVYGSSLVMFRTTEQEQLAAWLFMKWLVTPESDARAVKTTGLFPLRGSTMNQLADYKASHPQWAQAVDLIPQGSLQPQLGSWRLVRIMLGDGFANMFRVSIPSTDVETVLSQMDSISEEISK